MASLRRILITGATGKQGGAVLRALTALPTPQFELLALTRDVNSPTAQALLGMPNVKLVQGNLDAISSIFNQPLVKEKSLYGVFSVQTPENHTKEERQGKELASAAANAGVAHFVYTSADRGGEQRSARDATVVPHFKSKYNIEKHIEQLSRASQGRFRYSFIRPVAFMENLTPDFFGKVFGSRWRLMGVPMRLTSTPNIGILAARMFEEGPTKWHERAPTLVTDELGLEEAAIIFKKVFPDQQIPLTYDAVTKSICWLAWSRLGIMFEWIEQQGFGGDLHEFRGKAEYTGMQNFEDWLRDSSKFRSSQKIAPNH